MAAHAGGIEVRQVELPGNALEYQRHRLRGQPRSAPGAGGVQADEHGPPRDRGRLPPVLNDGDDRRGQEAGRLLPGLVPLERDGRAAVPVDVEVTDVQRDEFGATSHQAVGEQEERPIAFTGERVG